VPSVFSVASELHKISLHLKECYERYKNHFSMIGVGKIHKPNRQVLKDIYLSFYYGAKIGVLGLNGAGKSTLLKIIAGVDTEYIGQIQAQKGITFGYLQQEPELDPSKTVRQIVEEGVQRLSIC